MRIRGQQRSQERLEASRLWSCRLQLLSSRLEAFERLVVLALLVWLSPFQKHSRYRGQAGIEPVLTHKHFGYVKSFLYSN